MHHATVNNCKGKLLSLEEPRVMGIINLTSDSFYDSSRLKSVDEAVALATKMISEGADILDIGAVSTRPGSIPISGEEELDKLMPVLTGILDKFPNATISVDTWRSEVAGEVIASGASMINDISGGSLDNNMFPTIAELQVPYVMMHIQGTPETMQIDPRYDDVTVEIIDWLAKRAFELRKMGVNDIIIDAGFGFGKTLEHNYTLLNQLEYLKILELPILVGLSRKSMIYKPMNSKPENVLSGTIALNFYALTKGANILRVHDVKEAVETIEVYKLTKAYQ